MTSGPSGGAPNGASSNREQETVCWHKVLPAADLKRRALRKVRVAGSVVVLVRLEDGALAAPEAVCPHEGADLSQGRVYMGAIDCPRHHYLYDLRSGRNRYPRNVFPADLAANLAPLPLHPVREESGWIWVGKQRG